MEQNGDDGAEELHKIHLHMFPRVVWWVTLERKSSDKHEIIYRCWKRMLSITKGSRQEQNPSGAEWGDYVEAGRWRLTEGKKVSSEVQSMTSARRKTAAAFTSDPTFV